VLDFTCHGFPFILPSGMGASTLAGAVIVMVTDGPPCSGGALLLLNAYAEASTTPMRIAAPKALLICGMPLIHESVHERFGRASEDLAHNEQLIGAEIPVAQLYFFHNVTGRRAAGQSRPQFLRHFLTR
jgi:hypothetical protein